MQNTSSTPELSQVVFTPVSITDLISGISQNVAALIMAQAAPATAAPAVPSPVEYITRKAAARLLGITLPTLHKWSVTGKIPAYRIARQVRYKKSEVEQSLSQFKTLAQ